MLQISDPLQAVGVVLRMVNYAAGQKAASVSSHPLDVEVAGALPDKGFTGQLWLFHDF